MFQNQKKISLLLILAIGVFPTYGQKIYSYVFCHTNDKDLAIPAEVNFAKVSVLFSNIAQSLPKYEYIPRSLTATGFNEKDVIAMLEKDKFGADDIVLFYINTHGKNNRWGNEALFPVVTVPSNLLPSYNFFATLYKRRPKLCIAIIEACNGFGDKDDFQIRQEAFVTEEYSQQQTESIEMLNLRTTSNLSQLVREPISIIVTGGPPGMETYALGNGSIFTNAFIKAFNETLLTTDQKKANWRTLLERSKELTLNRTQSDVFRDKHYPVWQIYKNGGVSQTVKDSSARFTELSIDTQKKVKWPFQRTQWYKISLTVNSGKTVDSVQYFLDHTMPNPIVTVKNADQKFLYSFTVWGQYPIKAKVYFRDGSIEETFNDIRFRKGPSKI
ncbi:pYEATS domain-containing protein [Ohtaekwangia kribbensis]|uniref:PYEATS domain-containing protein n=1 Tax=Ohtaekwangia kribbensis TaxID=688913 RepID=A0ABW3JYR4_9BACT